MNTTKICDEHELTETIVCSQSAYAVPVKVAREIKDLRESQSELLEALKTLLSKAESDEKEFVGTAEQCGVIHAARAAIAKAERP